MAAPPGNVALATAFVEASPDEVYEALADVGSWSRMFAGWLSEVRPEDDRFGATGAEGDRYDLYAHPGEDGRSLDVEVIDELGNADVMRLRVIEARGGGCFAIAAIGRMAGVSDEHWARVRNGVAAGLEAIVPPR